MAGCYCLPLAKPIDPTSLPHPMDQMCSSTFFSNPHSYSDYYFQSTYFDSCQNGNHYYHSLAQEATLDNSRHAEVEMLDTWNPDNIFDSPQKDLVSSLSNRRTPSLCESPNNRSINTDSQPLTPTEELSIKPNSSEPQVPPKRKRGRPRLVRAISESKARKPRLSKRQPHSEVERKYRDGLNTELDRLRMAIPSLSNLDSQLLNGTMKLSKAMILTSAIDYIREMELERDRLQQENEVLRADRTINAGQGKKVNGGY